MHVNRSRWSRPTPAPLDVAEVLAALLGEGRRKHDERRGPR